MRVFTVQKRSPAKWVLLGEHNKKSTEDDRQGHSKPELYNIIAITNHPEYQEPSIYHDITLFKLDRNVVFSEYMRPICLQTDYAVRKPYAIVTGWGTTSSGENWYI